MQGVGGPFGNLLQQLFGGAMGNMQQGQQETSQQRPTPTSLNPAQAAGQAAERRATSGQRSDGSSEEPLPAPQPSSSGFHGVPGATFIWSSADGFNRPEPHHSGNFQHPPSQNTSSQQTSQPQQHPQQQQQQHQGNVPIRNLASFLTEAFSGPTQQQQQPDSSQSTYSGQALPTSPLQEGPAQNPNPQTDDILTHMLRTLAGGAGVPIGGQQGQQNLHTQGQDSQQPENAGNRSGNMTRIVFGNPGNGVAFSFGTTGMPSGAGGEAGMLPFPFPFGIMGGSDGGMPGRMGDFVYTQGAMDK